MTRLIFLFQFALVVILASMAWKISHTGKAPLESERDAYTRLAWVDRSGAVLESVDLKGRYIQPRLSADGKTALLTRVEPGGADLWSLSVPSHSVRRLTAGKKRSAFAVWGPHSGQYIFAFHGKLLQRAAETEPEVLYLRNTPDFDWLLLNNVPEDWSVDGRSIVFSATGGIVRPSQLYLLPIGTGTAFPLVRTKAEVSEARFSKDGNWIALTSNMTGRNEVYVSPVPHDLSALPVPEQSLIRVSDHGGHSPEWGPNGELLYVGADGDLIAAAGADTGSRHAAHRLFQISSIGLPAYEYRFGGYSVDGNGQRFLIALSARPPLSARH